MGIRVLQGSIRSREWLKWWCFAHVYGKNEVRDDGPRGSALLSEEAIRNFSDRMLRGRQGMREKRRRQTQMSHIPKQAFSDLRSD